ncbi:uncharacterized protein proca1 [Takifugu flavidus]|uniref:phospholipase A2 n=1 Tax=Takifugu flavidus TaxID=433684 RepID=A0A5C6PFJ9_9TELE|nr:uncharacterized protein proca1 [Takifugu flavidus]TWW77000.1 Group 3 secretory phospholipase A2 [Takifugu flavidus]
MWSIFFVFLSYLDRDLVKAGIPNRAVDAEKETKEMFSSLNGTVCAKMLIDGGNFLYRVSDGVEIVQSVVSPSGKVVNCSVLVNQMQVKSFMRKCKLGLKVQEAAQQMDARFAHMDEAKLMCRELKENTERGDMIEDDNDHSEKVFKRSKRGFTYPGTLWCGAGNTADHYNQLGEFAETDSCCRIHDHCPHVIHAFSSRFGYTNFKWHSISHCDCDENLKACLRRVNDTSSRVVGQAFFNVIGVPCFDFAYEEQCAERHWYGLCKRYEKFPTAVLKKAVPYDYGGIDIIDKLPLPSSKKTDPQKEENEESASKAQSKISGPEEPSLTNVVNAAEDFIKVLATVSTSQSSTTSSDRGETQSSEKKKKKKRKNNGKKKNDKKKKGRGKWRKSRKQKAEAGSKADEGTATSTSGGKGEVKGLSTFISETHGHDLSRKHVNTEIEPVRKEEPLNEVMKDEPVIIHDTVSMTSIPASQMKPEAPTEIPHSSTTTGPPQRMKIRRLKERKRTIPFAQKIPVNITEVAAQTPMTTTRVSQPQQLSAGGDAENQSGTSNAGLPSVSPKVKRTRSKASGEREWRKKRRKDSSASPTVAAPKENNPAEHLKAIPLTEAPTEPSDRNIGRTVVRDVPLNTSFSVLKTQKLKARALGSSQRKAILSAAGQKPSHTLDSLISPPPQTSEDSRARVAATGVPTEETQAHTERLSPTITKAPSVTKNRHRHTIRGQRRSRKRTRPSAATDGVSVFKQTEQTAAAFTTTFPDIAATREPDLQRSGKITASTSASPVLSPVQLSVNRLQAQFNRKKRRKMAMRQQ